MKNNFLTHKLLPILSIFMLCVFALCTSVFAIDVTLNNNIVTLSSDITSYKEFVIFTYKWDYDNKYYVEVLATNGKFTFMSSSPEYSNSFYVTSTDTIYGKSVLLSDSSSLSSAELLPYVIDYNSTRCSLKTCDFVYSTCSIVDSIDGTLVFQGAPQVPEITKALVEQTTQLGMKPLEAIKVILPVVIVTIVGLIAFWKAWQLLSKQLKKA